MGIEKYLVEATVIGVVAQRLVRRITEGGYSQRIGLFEVMDGAVPRPGMSSLRDDAKIKIGRGITCVEEIDRVLPLEG
jgi:type II secretory ATPase GspE/PulE/Tfp pilus assembly ATPase PilB-like protein